MTKHKKLLSIVIPVLNEAENITLVYHALRAVLEALPYRYEIIFVNDGSTDTSGSEVEKLTGKDSAVKYIEFSRNFGKEMATTAGIEASSGDAVIMIDADMQHPPALLPKLIEKWEKGAEVAVGIRIRNSNEGFTKRVGSRLFYSLMRLISETKMERGETDFRLIDRRVADAFCALSEQRRMTRSLINWLGFKREAVLFEAPARAHGSAKYSPGKLLHLALHSFIGNSLIPLRLAGYLGVAITSFSGVLGLIVFVQRYIFNDVLHWNISGPAQLAILNVFLIGIVLMALGIIALYIANIHTEVADRPLYIVRKRTNFK